MAGKHVAQVTYHCHAKGCGKPASAPEGSGRGLLLLCEPCFDDRYAKGKAKQQEASRG